MEPHHLKQRGRHQSHEPATASVLPSYSNDDSVPYGRDRMPAEGFDAYVSDSKVHSKHKAFSTAYAAAEPSSSQGSDRMAVQIGDLHLFSLRDGVPGLLRSKDAAIVFLLTLASLFTRLYQIGRRPNVTWDEAHFGKFGAYYINHTFYHDVHPPLAKMMVALAEVIAGHNGTFRFSSGKKYPEYVDYTLMRAQIAMYGVALVPLAFLTCIQFRLSRPMATLAAVFVLFDNALCVMSRFILLDEPLLFFTALTLWSASNFQNRNKHGPPYTRAWWSWLAMTGFSLGCVMSSKWVGLFCVIMVGIATAEDLVRKYCDMMPWREYGRHWVARALCLILIPLLVYTLTFWIHFKVLYKAGSGDFKMPANFQANLKGNMLNSQPYDIAYGALVDIRAVYNGPGLLHSHVHQYPKGSRQQQVTCFPHRDSNNVWQLRRPAGSPANYTIDPIDFVQDGDIIQLTHNLTGATIRASKGILAPLTVSHYEVAAENITHATDVGLTNWKIEVVKQKASRAGKRIHAMTTVFRLRHEDTGCIMRVGGRKLPEWGWHQSEVTCLPDSTRKKNVRSNDVLWYIEHNTNTRLAKDDLSKYVSSNFIVDMVTLNIEMGKTNNALSPDRDKYNSLESDPWSWPLLTFPMRMVGWGNKTIKYYEIGNPILWWASALVCFLYPFRLLYFVLRWQRQCNDWPRNGFREFWDNSKFLWGGWALHYIPFFLMGRVTYIHHYLPALYFALLQLAFDIDFALKRWRRGRYLTVAAWGIGAAVFVVFLYFAPFTFGWNKPMKELAGRRWLKTWNIYEDMYDM